MQPEGEILSVDQLSLLLGLATLHIFDWMRSCIVHFQDVQRTHRAIVRLTPYKAVKMGSAQQQSHLCDGAALKNQPPPPPPPFPPPFRPVVGRC